MKRCVRDLPEWKKFWRGTADYQRFGQPRGRPALALRSRSHTGHWMTSTGGCRSECTEDRSLHKKALPDQQWRRMPNEHRTRRVFEHTRQRAFARSARRTPQLGLILRARRVSPRLARPVIKSTLGSRSAWEKVTVKRAAARSIEDLSASLVRRIPRSRGRRRRPRSNFPVRTAPLDCSRQ
jgi:hypothetical protein